MDFRPTEQQQAVIAHDEGPLLVIAGPGSGKTFTLVERIVHLVVNKGVQPEQLLVATFTEKAAKEIISRVVRRLMQEGVNVNVDEMYIGTLHSIGLRLLEEHREFTRLKKNFTVMDQFDQNYFFFQHLNEFEQLVPVTLLLKEEKETSRWNKATLLCGWMNKLSEEMLSADALMDDPDVQAKQEFAETMLKASRIKYHMIPHTEAAGWRQPTEGAKKGTPIRLPGHA